MRPPALNDLLIATRVIGLRERCENLSAQKRSGVSFLPWTLYDAERQERGYAFLNHSSRKVSGDLPSGGELFQRSQFILQLDAQNSVLFLPNKNISCRDRTSSVN
jgi:hypothetical protein